MNRYLKGVLKKVIPNSFIIRTLQTNRKAVLITFDDGPHETFTPQVLSLLDKYNTRAVFFVVGKYVKHNEHILREILKRKHMIANHSYEHPNRPMVSYAECRQEVSRCQDLIHRIVGERPKYFRPPMGIISINGLLAAKRFHLKTVIWSCEGGDWVDDEKPCAEKIADRVLGQVKPGDIICLHDNQPNIVRTLDKLLPALERKGYNLLEGIDALPK